MLKEKYKEIENLKKAVRLVDLEGLRDITVAVKDMVLLINYINTLQVVNDNTEKRMAMTNARLLASPEFPQRLDMYM